MNQTAEMEPGVGLSQFNRDGFLLLEGFFAAEQVDRAVAAMGSLLDERPREVFVEDLTTGGRTFWVGDNRRDARHFRFSDLYLMSEELRELALDPGLDSVIEGVLGEPPALCSSLNLVKGGSRTIHIDSLYLTPRTPHKLAAAWIAFEDVHPDAGPLVYFPGSHRIPLYRFNDGSHHANPEEEADWFDYIDVQLRLRGLRERRFMAKKGDVLILHADLVHGGSQIRDLGRTRRSMACNYFGEADCRERDLELVPMHGGHWVRRLPQPVAVDPAAYGPDGPRTDGAPGRRPDARDGVNAWLFPWGERRFRNDLSGPGGGA
jgi:phytanoyl-CoA hydroxylase